jgi:4'-phosphopantetheinyl transferase
MKLIWKKSLSQREMRLSNSTNYILKQGDVHLWKVNLNSSPDTVEYLLETLSVDEIERAKRFYQEKHSKNFIIARGLLRVILGRYIGQKPASIVFKYTDKGKPSLSQSGFFPLSFNLSHSQERVIYGLSYFERIGVDLEYQRNIADVEKLAKRFFTSKEYQYIQSLNNLEKNQLFLKLWTAKEAYLKATGEGIAGGLEKIEVRIGERGELSYDPPWSLYNFLLEEGYYAAIATPQKIENIFTFTLNEEEDQFYQEPDQNLQDEKDGKKEYA